MIHAANLAAAISFTFLTLFFSVPFFSKENWEMKAGCAVIVFFGLWISIYNISRIFGAPWPVTSVPSTQCPNQSKS